MMTFSKPKAPDLSAPPIDRLSPAADLRPRAIAARKMASPEFLALVQHWR